MIAMFKHTLAVAVLTLLASLIVSPTLATAQDTPYSPKKIPRNKLIDLGDFSRSPIQLPWTPVRVTTVSNTYGSLNFEHLLNESFEDITGYFVEHKRTNKPVVSLASDVMRYSKITELHVRGFDLGPSESNITLGFAGLPRHIMLKVEREGTQTKLTVINSTHTMEYSGVMPARAPLQPVGADPISFRGN